MRTYFTFAALVAIGLSLTANSAFAASAAGAEPKNLLPNASFELGMGQGLPTTWGDYHNRLTIKLATTKQFPASSPTVEVIADAVEGRSVAQLGLDSDETGFHGHLTSSVVTMEPGRAYTLSAYARSSAPSAKLRLSLWTRPMDWREAPDAQSTPLSLTEEWKRYEFCFTVGTHVRIAVVDLVALADAAGTVQFDAIQLEPGPAATDFSTRFPVEVSLSAKEKPYNGGLQLMGEPLTVDVDLYNSTTEDHDAGLELQIRDQDDRIVAAQALKRGVPPGYSERKVSLDFGLLGDFIGTCEDRNQIAVHVSAYRFTVHPVIAQDKQAVLVSVDGKVSELPAERVTLPWSNSGDWYAEPAQELVVNKDGSIYVFACNGIILRTMDGGRTWDESYEAGSGFAFEPGSPSEIVEAGLGTAAIRGPMYSMSVVGDSVFLDTAHDSENNRVLVKRSEDRGKTWSLIGEIPNIYYYQPGQILELDDGTYLWTVCNTREGFPTSAYAYRSTDRGKTWSGTPICPGGEPFVCKLKSGRLLAVVRYSVALPPGRFDLYHKNQWHWSRWQRALGRPALTSHRKNLILLDSDDGGITWSNARDGTYGLDEMHGMVVELPDGRIMLLYVHRVPWVHGGERAKTSRDGGYTWEEETYYLNSTPAYPGYSASCVLPPHLADGKPGMILTVIGERGENNDARGAKMQAIRWRPLP